MAKATLLLADNNQNFLATRARVLEDAGYRVRCAEKSVDARLILETEPLDAAILDLRLDNDKDENDISGLLLAQECARALPKIIMTQYPSYERAVAALVAKPGSYPPAVRFIEKNPQGKSGIEVMLQAVKEALQIGRKGFGLHVDDVTAGLNADYEQARQDARMQTWIAGVITLLGIVVILVGVGVALWQPEIYPVGAIAAAGGLVTEAVNYLFIARLNRAHSRVDRFHRELYQIKLLETLRFGADELVKEDDRESTHMQILLQACRAWFPTESMVGNGPLQKAEREHSK